MKLINLWEQNTCFRVSRETIDRRPELRVVIKFRLISLMVHGGVGILAGALWRVFSIRCGRRGLRASGVVCGLKM